MIDRLIIQIFVEIIAIMLFIITLTVGLIALADEIGKYFKEKGERLRRV